MPEGPLAGIRILDLTHVWAGPLGTRALADLGAEVIKVEAPMARGALNAHLISRGMYPHNDPGEEPWNRQAVFNKLNRNKKSLCIHLKTAAGRQLFLDLVATSDVVIENFSASAMRSLRLDYPVLQEANPRIIYVAMPGFGASGPCRDFVAYGPSVEPMCGLTSLMGYNATELRSTAIALPDAMSGVTATAAVVTALARRAADGTGGFLDMSMQEAGMALLGEYFVEQQLTGQQPAVRGNSHPYHAPYGTYRCQGDDHWIVIACQNQQHWEALCRLAGQGWEQEARFVTLPARLQQRAALDQVIATWTQGQDKLALMATLQQHGVPAGAVMTAPEFMDDPHLKARGFFVALGGEHIPTFSYPGAPGLLDGQRGEGWHRAPKLGEHNHAVLQQLLGLDSNEIQRLTDAGVLLQRPPA